MDDYKKEWDEWDDPEDFSDNEDYDVDPAFTSWEQVDSMFYNKYL